MLSSPLGGGWSGFHEEHGLKGHMKIAGLVLVLSLCFSRSNSSVYGFVVLMVQWEQCPLFRKTRDKQKFMLGASEELCLTALGFALLLVSLSTRARAI